MSESPPMRLLLEIAEVEGWLLPERLAEMGYHPNAIYSKALTASRKGYTDCGVVADRPWLTPKGKQRLDEWRSEDGSAAS